MKEKRPHLGRGLEALLGPIVAQTETELNPPSEPAPPTFHWMFRSTKSSRIRFSRERFGMMRNSNPYPILSR
jgi:hypothetical protein